MGQNPVTTRQIFFAFAMMTASALAIPADSSDAKAKLVAGLECRNRIPIENPSIKALLVAGPPTPAAEFKLKPGAGLTVYGLPASDAEISEQREGGKLASILYVTHVQASEAQLAKAIGGVAANGAKDVKWPGQKIGASIVTQGDVGGTSELRCTWENPQFGADQD